MLMLKLIAAHLRSLPGPPTFTQSIEYRNLAPLCCDEELRLCLKEKMGLRTEDGGIYDVWIEGPSGGMAVKAVVRTSVVPEQEPLKPPDLPQSGTDKAEGKDVDLKRRHGAVPHIRRISTIGSDEMRRADSENPRRSEPRSRTSPSSRGGISARGGRRLQPRRIELTPFSLPVAPTDSKGALQSTESAPSGLVQSLPLSLNDAPIPLAGISAPSTSSTPPPKRGLRSLRQISRRLYRRARALDLSVPIIRRVQAVPRPLRAKVSLRTQRLLQLLTRQNPEALRLEPIPLVRKFGARPHNDPKARSRYEERGIRRIVEQRVRVRRVATRLKNLKRRRRRRYIV